MSIGETVIRHLLAQIEFLSEEIKNLRREKDHLEEQNEILKNFISEFNT